MFVSSGSPAVAEALAHTGLDWLCLDAQHGAVGYAELQAMLQATASGNVRTIVRVGGPSDRFGIQQALDLGATGVMVPLVNTVEEAAQAVSYCLYPPQGARSIVAPCRAVLTQEGAGREALARYIPKANQRVQVWLQVETVEGLDNLDAILAAVPGIHCTFLGPADMCISLGLHTKAAAAAQPGGAGFDLGAATSGPEMEQVYGRVAQTCLKHGVAPGVFCVGPVRAAQLAALGYAHMGIDVDTNALVNHALGAVAQLRARAA